jgi:hypothetical protein
VNLVSEVEILNIVYDKHLREDAPADIARTKSCCLLELGFKQFRTEDCPLTSRRQSA